MTRFAAVLVVFLVFMPIQAQTKKKSAASKLATNSVVTESDAKEFAGGPFEREAGELGPATHVTIKAMKGDVFSHHLTVYLETMPSDIPAYPNYVKDMVTQTADSAMPSDNPKKFKCTVAGSPASACLEVNSPMGSFKEGQRMVKVLFGKGRTYVKIEMLRDFRPDLDSAMKLASKIMTRLP